LYHIVAASTKLSGGVKYNVQQIFLHDQYNPRNPYQYDVAVIKLRDALDFTETMNIKPVPVVPEGEEPSPGSDVVVAGWGRTIPVSKISRQFFKRCYFKMDDPVCGVAKSRDAVEKFTRGLLFNHKLPIGHLILNIYS